MMECPDCHYTPCPKCGVCKCFPWRTMSTAPKDGQTILVFDDIHGCPVSAWWESTFEDAWMRYGTDTKLRPVAWVPLPEPPENYK